MNTNRTNFKNIPNYLNNRILNYLQQQNIIIKNHKTWHKSNLR